MELISGDVSIRRFRNDDIQRIAQLANNEMISQNLRDAFPHPYSEKDAEEFIKRCLAIEPNFAYAVCYKGEYVGNIGIMQEKDVYRKSVEIGYFIGEPYWNLGIATKAVNLICDYTFANFDIARIHTGIFEYNKASCRVLEKSGFQKEGVFRKSVFKMGRLWDEIRYARVKEE
ncbi:MAG: GNAT family protein [Bacteroidota bacterium]|nr:GNAT family protein [Bacteroidota bacterium]